MLHRPQQGWAGVPATPQSSYHSVNIVNVYRVSSGDSYTPTVVTGVAEQEKGTDMDSHLRFLTECAVIRAIGASILQPTPNPPAATGCWHHNPQIYSTKAVREVLIPNPCESIHFCPASSCAAHHWAVWADKEVWCRGGLKAREVSLLPEGRRSIPWASRIKSWRVGGPLLAPLSLPPLRCPWVRPLTPVPTRKWPADQTVVLQCVNRAAASPRTFPE